ncbi:MAG TPA: DUF255 domain-containing protein [Gemmatimonadales bacterium]|nr:DUF255 domain-containing protein [Gemmatimonadales bacterium]
MRSPFAPFVALCAISCATEHRQFTNEMAQSATSYLARAAGEPVGWQRWTRATFSLAARLDRPILLYIGAEDCRGCAAMDRETYASAEVGAVIDSLFVPVRVDRDERPDVAQRYGVAVEVLTGLRGYPLTVFLTPDGSAFFGGTYFPADDPVTGRGIKQILPEVARSFRTHRDFIVRQAALVRQLSLNRQTGAHGVLEPGAVAARVDRVRAALAQAVDHRLALGTVAYGQAAELALAAAARSADPKDLRLARALLDVLADSGDVLAAKGERDEPPMVVRAGMVRNLALGWGLIEERRYWEAARRGLENLLAERRLDEPNAVFADRAAYVIGAALEAATAIGDSAAERKGVAALDTLLARSYVAGRGVRHGPGDSTETRSLLQDQVQVASAAMAAFRATGEPRYLQVAADLAAVLERDFADPLGGYFDASEADRAVPGLVDRTQQVWDNLLPGANAWAARVLLQLAEATGEAGYRRRAEATMEAFAGLAPTDEVLASSYLTVAQAILATR